MYKCASVERISIGTDRGGHSVVDNVLDINFALAQLWGIGRYGDNTSSFICPRNLHVEFLHE